MASFVNSVVVGLSVLAVLAFAVSEFLKKRIEPERGLRFILGIISFWSGLVLLVLLFLVFIEVFGIKVLDPNEALFLNDYGILLLVGGVMSGFHGIMSIQSLYPNGNTELKKEQDERVIINKLGEMYDNQYRLLQELATMKKKEKISKELIAEMNKYILILKKEKDD
ncbi:TPA: hypothetical protein HA243_06000 [Candidatus Micrarchaeota archaeon]|nr:hypothetical protein [Candidatus Micrarchaeota archaeon]